MEKEAALCRTDSNVLAETDTPWNEGCRQDVFTRREVFNKLAGECVTSISSGVLLVTVRSIISLRKSYKHVHYRRRVIFLPSVK
jgi:hypothetical protein